MLADDGEQALSWGQRALELATRLGDDATRAHAVVNMACARVQMDPDATGALLEARELADSAGEREDATRALGNLGYVLMSWARPEEALIYSQRALDYAAAYEVHTSSRTCAPGWPGRGSAAANGTTPSGRRAARSRPG